MVENWGRFPDAGSRLTAQNHAVLQTLVRENRSRWEAYRSLHSTASIREIFSASDYAIKSILLIDFINVADIAIASPFPAVPKMFLKTFISIAYENRAGLRGGSGVHLVAVLEGNFAKPRCRLRFCNNYYWPGGLAAGRLRSLL